MHKDKAGRRLSFKRFWRKLNGTVVWLHGRPRRFRRQVLLGWYHDEKRSTDGA